MLSFGPSSAPFPAAGLRAGRAALPSLTAATDDIEPRGRFEHWRDLYRDFADLEVEPGRRDAFRSRTETWRFGPFMMMEASGSALRFRRTDRHCARDPRDMWCLRLSLDTAWNAVSDDRAPRIAPGALWLHRTSRPSLSELPQGNWRVLMLPADACPQLSAGLSRLGAGALGAPGAGLLADVVAGLPARLRAMPEDTPEAMADSLRGVLAATLFAALDPVQVRRVAAESAQRARAEEVIRRNLGSALLDVDRIAKFSGVSRSMLYRMFEGEGGVARFVRDLRLRQVLADLRDPALSALTIAEIAERRGLHNATSFSRAFRLALGLTPRDARASARFGLPPSASPTAISPPPSGEAGPERGA